MRIYLIIFVCFFTILGCDKRKASTENIGNLDSIGWMCAPPPTLIFNFTLKGEPIQAYDIRAHFLYYYKNGVKTYLNDFRRIPFPHPFYLDTYSSREVTSRSFYNKVTTFYIDYWDNNDIDTITFITTGGKQQDFCNYKNVIKFNGHDIRSEATPWGATLPLILFDK